MVAIMNLAVCQKRKMSYIIHYFNVHNRFVYEFPLHLFNGSSGRVKHISFRNTKGCCPPLKDAGFARPECSIVEGPKLQNGMDLGQPAHFHVPGC